MIDLETYLEDSGSYVNSGNLLSKSLLLQEYQKNKKTLFVVNESKKILHFSQIFNYIGLEHILVKDYAGLFEMLENEKGLYIVDQSFFELEIPEEYQRKNSFSIQILVWDTFPLTSKISQLSELGFTYSEHGKIWSYKKMWDTLHVYPSFTEKYYFRLSFFDDEVEKIEQVSQQSTQDREVLVLGKLEKLTYSKEWGVDKEIISLLQEYNIQIIADSLDFYTYKKELQESFPSMIFLDAIKNNRQKNHNLGIHELYLDDLGSLTQKLQDTTYADIFIFTKNKSTLDNFLNYNNITQVKVRECRVKNMGSFYTDIPGKKNTLLIADDNLDRVFVKKRVKRSFSKDLDLLVHIKPWDYITHIDHGVWLFQWIIKRELQIWGKIISKEYLELEYLESDKLFVPITEVKRVSKYIGKEHPKLTNLWTKEWSKKLKKVGAEVDDIAEELLDVFAKRQLKKWFQCIRDNKAIDVFQGNFPYTYTDDQSAAIDEIIEDMWSEHPMDRLLNGDVGFWKTEVCFNAIYNAFLNKKQSILLTPLVVLAYEHYEKALERFGEFGMKVWVLTRFEKAASVERTLKALQEWKIDLVVGTHKLLSKDVIFKDLWLVVIDEEHKFWVKDKERIKELKGQIDILSLSATPIPRSLNMALNGLKQVSILKTPPYGRKPIETYVSRFSDEVIIDACRAEFETWGQVFFIHNRVQNIEAFQNYLQTLFPHKSIVVTHGQLPGDELEKRIIAFRKREYDVLLSTTVIENGVDFPNVNTIFINDAYKFGISQIHQLRGRVGRSQKQWYCYLMYRNENINAEAEKRLKTIVDYSHLWAGFELAMRDLEVRGWGEILGKKQSGQAAEVGISIFIEMLETKIEELKRVREYSAKKALPGAEKNVLKSTFTINTTIDLNISAYIPDEFFGSSMDKMNFYRELETVESVEDLQTIIDEFKQTNPELPPETQNLFTLLRLKFVAANAWISAIKKNGQNYQLDFQTLEGKELEVLKTFLNKDKEVRFIVIDVKRLRTPFKKYGSDLAFMTYLYDLLQSKKTSTKYKLKK